MEIDDLAPGVRAVAIQPYQWWGKEQWAEYRRINTDDDVSDEELETVLQALEQWALVQSEYVLVGAPILYGVLVDVPEKSYRVVIDPSWTHYISFFDMDTFRPRGEE